MIITLMIIIIIVVMVTSVVVTIVIIVLAGPRLGLRRRAGGDLHPPGHGAHVQGMRIPDMGIRL